MENILTKITETEATAITDTHLETFLTHLKSASRAPATVSQYSRTLRSLQSWLSGRPLTPELLMEWKTHLTGIFAPSSTNAALAAANSFLICMKREPGHAPGWDAFEKLSYLKVQRRTFCEKDRVLEEKEYACMIQTAREQGDEKTALLLETLCALGIRVSELAYITVEALKQKKAVVSLKGKIRTILISNSLALKLRDYVRKNHITSGAVFVTRTGNPVSRGWVWLKMKKLAEAARVEAGKVFPHNLRHLFTRTHYKMYKDISKLADLLGHSSINTTRIYLLESGEEHAQQLEQLGLVL